MSLLGAVVGGAVSLFGGSRAADAQEAASEAQVAEARRVSRYNEELSQPFLSLGVDARNALAFEMGLGDRPMVGGQPARIEKVRLPNGKQGYKVGDRHFGLAQLEAARAHSRVTSRGGQEYGGFQETPGYQFQFDEGQRSAESSAAARGGLVSGATLQALQARGQGLANQEYNTYLNRLSGMTNSGQNAVFGQVGANTSSAGYIQNALAGRGNAQAAGYVGAANAVNSGIENYLGYQQFNNLANPSTANYSSGNKLGPDWASGWF